eukprot:4203364-Pleurochrysis_carterae.AAC.5
MRNILSKGTVAQETDEHGGRTARGKVCYERCAPQHRRVRHKSISELARQRLRDIVNVVRIGETQVRTPSLAVFCTPTKDGHPIASTHSRGVNGEGLKQPQNSAQTEQGKSARAHPSRYPWHGGRGALG